MPSKPKIIYIQPGAPRKPALGAPCNGCGVCCLVAPCPLGVVLSGSRTGACKALRWVPGQTGELTGSGTGAVYRCSAISQPKDALAQRLPAALQGLIPVMAPVLSRLARRWVAAGQGCDSSLEVSDGPENLLSKSAESIINATLHAKR